MLGRCGRLCTCRFYFHFIINSFFLLTWKWSSTYPYVLWTNKWTSDNNGQCSFHLAASFALQLWCNVAGSMIIKPSLTTLYLHCILPGTFIFLPHFLLVRSGCSAFFFFLIWSHSRYVLARISKGKTHWWDWPISGNIRVAQQNSDPILTKSLDHALAK